MSCEIDNQWPLGVRQIVAGGRPTQLMTNIRDHIGKLLHRDRLGGVEQLAPNGGSDIFVIGLNRFAVVM
jgi:hypothetical protein